MQVGDALARLSFVDWAGLITGFVTAVSTATGATILWFQHVAARRRN